MLIDKAYRPALALLIILLSAVIAPLPSGADEQAAFADGGGAEDDPYLIENAEHLNNIRHHLNARFKQIADIDLSDYSEGAGWTPVGNRQNTFEGVYDGNGFAIANLTIDSTRSDYRGLFGYTGANATIENLTLRNVNIKAGSQSGGLVGVNRGQIQNCRIEGELSGDASLGGIAGSNAGTIKNSYCNVTASGKSNVGGIAGFSNGLIVDSHTDGKVSVDQNGAGGIAGNINRGKIINCYSNAEVHGRESIGGLVGSLSGHIADSHATGNVNGTGSSGGLVGYISSGEIENCHAEGDVEGSRSGGLAGVNRGKISNSFSKGDVSGSYRAGGLVGINENDGEIRNSYALGNAKAEGFQVRVGGLAGDNIGNIAECFARGNVEKYSHGGSAGGLVGQNERDAHISRSYAEGNVTATSGVLGGLVGINEGHVSDTYAKGNVSGEGALGGLVGRNWEVIRNSYAIGKVERKTYSGGLIGINDYEYAPEGGGRYYVEGRVINCFYNRETTDQDDTGKGEQKNTEDMMWKATFTGWDFEEVWAIDEEEGFPYLQWEKAPGPNERKEENRDM